MGSRRFPGLVGIVPWPASEPFKGMKGVRAKSRFAQSRIFFRHGETIMSRINTNVSSLIAQRVLTQNNNKLNLSLQRLSTGLRINSGADDPAGLIASENLRAE